MKARHLVSVAITAGALIGLIVLYGLGASPSRAEPATVGSPALDSAVVERLSRPYWSTQPAGIEAAADVTGTLASTLAADLLLNPIDYYVDLPLVTRNHGP
jgi:hypothetical protein